MAKKIIWLLVSCLMVLSLVMASCGTAVVEEEEEEEEEERIEEEEEEERIEEEEEEEEGLLPPEVPKYGGTLTLRTSSDPMAFDDNRFHQSGVTTGFFTNEELLQGDWAKGPAGTGENDWQNGFIGRIELETGRLAESWEFPEPGTLIWHIRKGVHWQNKPPVNGREFTADDAVFNLTRWMTITTSWMYPNYAQETTGYGPGVEDIKALDKYTVEAKFPEILFGQVFVTLSDFGVFHYPPEAIEKYGDMSDWRNACGTGPFMLTDYVIGSSMTYERNPDYWMKDPLHPENQLPYIDGVKQLILPDLSTALAALRTGKLDTSNGFRPNISWEDAELLMKQCPEMKYIRTISPPSFPVGRMDKEELPFKDIRVRQALNLAVNQQQLVDLYYNGHAYLLGYPYPPAPTYEKIYTPLEEQSEAVQELFTHNPEKAKQLLAEAGYPDGFKTTIDCNPTHVDLLSIIREDLLKVGVDMQINPMEVGVFTSVDRGRGHKEMLIKDGKDYAFPWRMMMTRIESMDNPAFIETPTFREAYEEMGRLVGKDDARVNEILKEIGKYSLEQAWGIWLPAYDTYTMWWPWLQNYYGANIGGYFNPNDWTQYSWIDQALKKSMGY